MRASSRDNGSLGSSRFRTTSHTRSSSSRCASSTQTVTSIVSPFSQGTSVGERLSPGLSGVIAPLLSLDGVPDLAPSNVMERVAGGIARKNVSLRGGDRDEILAVVSTVQVEEYAKVLGFERIQSDDQNTVVANKRRAAILLGPAPTWTELGSEVAS